ncbi:carbohydrate ABC transporter permease [Haloarcula marina]|uniref:carbohydrate ABC transporter permease n=1 Tax=Haloarcula marina TaxID=2961574 RepID=UPI0020B8DD12|nr:carbohydrate ABC transporter permease [Halomicroarcula marina]
MTRQNVRTAGLRFAAYAYVIAWVLVIMVPIYWMIVGATIPVQEFISTTTPRLLPGGEFFNNLESLVERQNVPFIRGVGNSILIASVYTGMSLFICSLAGFAFAKYEFKHKRKFFMLIIATLVLPINILVLPLFLLMAELNLVNTYWAVILPWLAHPLGIFLMRMTMQSIPDSLLESARLDGASEFQIFYRIALPTQKSTLAALGVILFLFQWNMFLWPLVVLDTDKWTIPVAMNQIIRQGVVPYDQLMVAAALSLIPMIIVFLALQKYFVKGILAGATKE